MNDENVNMSLNKGGHLDENSIAVCAEWLSGKKINLPPEVKEHLKNCTYCKNEVLEISELINTDKSQGKIDILTRDRFEETCAAKHSLSIKPVSTNQFWRVAAIFIVLITVTSLAIFIKPDRKQLIVSNDSPSDIGVIDSLKDTLKNSGFVESEDSALRTEGVKIESVEKDLFAANFVPNPGLEALIGAQFRSGEKPEITSPGKDTLMSCGSKLKFSGTNPSKEKLELQILDNNGNIEINYPDIENLSIVVSLEFDPGLYYWKLVGEDELYQLGKVILKEK